MNKKKNELDVQKMLERMSSFYLEHLPYESEYEKWLDSLVSAWKLFKEKLEQLDDNSLPNTARTLRTVPFFEIDATNSIYNKSVAKEVQKNKGDDQVIVALHNRKHYTELEFWEIGVETPIVYSMDLYTDFDKNNKLEINKDYFIRRNKLYLMPDLILSNNQTLNKLYAFDIKINDFTLELNWGDDIPIRVPFLMPRYQYRKLVTAYQKLMNSNYYISDILEAIHEFTESVHTEITDIRSRDISVARKRMYDEYLLSPLDFIVTLNEEDIKDKMQTNVILHMVTFAKHTDTFFFLMFLIERFDEMEAEEFLKFKICIDRLTEGEVQEDIEHSLTLEYEDDFFCNPYYDGDRTYDMHPSPYDKDECALKGDGIHMDSEDYHMDSDSPLIMMDSVAKYKNDHFEIRVFDHPEIPRNFNVSKSTLKFDKNKGITEVYEIYGSKDGKQFDLIREVKHDDVNKDKIEVSIANEVSRKIRYYKIRAKERTNESLFSLIEEVK